MIIWGKRVPTKPCICYDPRLKTKCIAVVLLLEEKNIFDKSNGIVQSVSEIEFLSFFVFFRAFFPTKLFAVHLCLFSK